MEWEELLAEFRALGGVAENVRLGYGTFGRGVFPIDPSKPATLHASPNILVPADEVEVRDGNLMLKPLATIGARERAFFETLHANFGWGAGLFDEMRQAQQAWSELPPDVVGYIANMGGTRNPEMRFIEPSSDHCFYHFIKSRDFLYDSNLYLAPLIDLVNHSSLVPTYVLESGIGVHGTFPDEMLVRYNLVDSWAYALVYGFAEPAPQAYSLGITVGIFGRNQLVIDRDVGEIDIRAGIRYPTLHIEGDVLHVSHLLLGNLQTPDLPRAQFRQLVAQYLNLKQADDVFDSIAHFNRQKFIGALRVLRNYDGPLIRMLEDAATDQLEALSACIGARSLE